MTTDLERARAILAGAMEPGSKCRQQVLAGQATSVTAKRAIEAMLAFASQQAPVGWMPIDTAPKDGEPILIWKPDERMVGEYMMAAYWADDHHSGEPGFVPVGGHHKLGYLSGVTGTPQGYPTRWRPLPTPPAMLDAAPSVTLGSASPDTPKRPGFRDA